MIKLLIILAVLLTDTIPTDSLTTDTVQTDSLVTDTIKPLSVDSMVADTAFFDTALSAIDAPGCPVDTVIPELPDSVYIQRLQALPFVIEMPYNQIVRAFILRYVNKRKEQLARLQTKSDYYFPIFDDALCRYNLPYELCYLPVIESALNPTARSYVGAAGLWQFMPSTGRLYGLEINTLVDERLDPIKSTDAACRFLKSLYATFGDWNLAIAAYNCGPGNINKAIHRSGGKRDFWSIYPYLPRETRSYVPIFIAAAYAMNYADMHGVCPDADLQMVMETDTIVSNKRQHLEQVSKVLDIDMDELRTLNPAYRLDVLPGSRPYALCLPADRVADYIDHEQDILAYKADSLIYNRRAEIDMAQHMAANNTYTKGGVTWYKIKKGDTLGGIAKKFHCTVKQLKAWNGLKSDAIREGQKLRIGKK